MRSGRVSTAFPKSPLQLCARVLKNKRAMIAASSAMGAVLLSRHAVAATSYVYTWTGGSGGTSTTWGTAGNWTPNPSTGSPTPTFPSATGDTADFGSAGTATGISIGGNRSIGEIILDSSDTVNRTISDNSGSSNYTLTLAGPTFLSDQSTAATTLTLSPTTSTGILSVTLSGSGSITDAVGDSIVISSVLSDSSGTLTKSGSGTLTLSGANTGLTSAIAISSGVLAITQDSAISNASSITFGGTGILQFNNYTSSLTFSSGSLDLGAATGTASTLSTNITGASTSLTYAGPGTLILAGTGDSYSGATSINAGILQFSQVLTMSANSAVTVNNGGTLAVNVGGTGEFTDGNGTSTAGTIGGLLNGVGGQGSSVTFASGSTLGIDTTNATGPITYSSNITNSGLAVNKLGTGTLILTGANTYSGITTITAGTLQIGNSGTTGSLGSGSVTDNGILAFNFSSGTTATVANIISGTGKIVQDGAGTVILSATSVSPNTETGGAFIYAGVLEVANTMNDLGSVSSNSSPTIDAGALRVDVTLATSRGAFLGATTSTIDVASGKTVTFNGAIANATSLTGTLNVNGTSGTDTGTLQLNSSGNTFSGGTNLNAGILNVNGNSSGMAATLGSGAISFVGGTLQYSTLNQTDFSSQFSTAASQAFSIDTNGQNVTFATALTSSGGTLTKLGSGTLTLTAAEAYTGATTISAGTLQLGNGTTDGSITNSSSVVDNGTLVFNIIGSQSNGFIVSGSGSVTKTGAGMVTMTSTAASSGAFNGKLSILGGTYAVDGFAGIGNTSGGTASNLTINGGTLQYLFPSGITTSIRLFTFGSTAAIDSSGAGEIQLTNTGSEAFTASSTAIALTLTGTAGNTVATANTLAATLADNGSGALSIVKSGSGEWELTGTNTFSGGVTLNAGTLVVGNAAALGVGTLTITGGSLDSGVASLVSSTNNAQSWNGDFTYVGSHNFSIGTGAVTLGGSRTVTVSAATFSVGGAIGDSGSGYSLTKAGAGTLVLTGANTYSGPSNVSGGTLQVGNGSTSGSLTTYTSNIVSGATLAFDRSDNISINNSFSGTGTVSNIGTDTVTLTGTGNNTSFGGIYAITGGGTLSFSSFASNLGNQSTGILISNNSTYQFTGPSVDLVSNHLFNLAGGPAILDIQSSSTTMTIEGIVSGTGSLVKTDAGTLYLFNGGNTYSGGTVINGGTLQIAAGASLGSSSALTTINSGTLSFNPSTGATASFGATRNIALGSSSSTIYVGTGSTFPIGGVISDSTSAGTLNKSGAGTLALSGTNTYSGGTTISGGKVQANNGTSSLGSGTTTVTGGVLAGTGATGGAATINGGTITAGSGATSGDTVGTLSTGTQTWTSGTYVAKVTAIASADGTVSASVGDQLVMSGLAASPSLNVQLIATTGSSPLFTVAGTTPTNTTAATPPPLGSYIVIADDTTPSGSSSNPFSSLVGQIVSLTGVTTAATGDQVELATFGDGSGGYDLAAEDISSPEPTSALLLGAVVSPLLLGRRRRAVELAVTAI